MSDPISKKIIHHRSISQLIHNLDDMTERELGTSNPGLSYDDTSTVSTARIEDNGTELSPNHTNNSEPLSPDSEYDEELAFPDSVTIVSMGGENPILVERKENDVDSITVETEIPFLNVYSPPVKFSSYQRKIFIPGVEVLVRITDNERNMTTHLLNPNLYTIELTHGVFSWTIKKRYKHFNALHSSLRMFRTSLNFPFPTRSHKEKRASFRNVVKEPVVTTGRAKKRKNALPRFPKKPDALLPIESIPDRIKQLEEYLYNLLNISLYRNHHETIEFVEVSAISFIGAIGDKGKEGLIKKRTGSTRPGQSGCNFCGMLQSTCCVRCNYLCSDVICGKWQNRWFFIKETCFGYYKPKDGSIRCVVLFDQGFDVSTGIYSTGSRSGVQIQTHGRHIILKSWTRRQSRAWMMHLKSIATGSARDFTLPNPHTSFAPVRTSMLAGWFVDGAGYMSAVADAMEGATEEIYVADWWLSPEIYMKRPVLDGDYWRLDKILQRKAQQGIKIFVLLYKEVEMALGINSYYSKQKLVQAHENIKVIRHPDHARVGVFFWAHHEKIVVVDQTYAFLGGIDLCYGRWDDYRHRLADLGSLTTANIPGTEVVLKSFPNFGDDSNAMSTPLKLHKTVSIMEESQEMGNPKKLPVLEPGDKLLICKPQTPEPCPENTKRNTPELERKNMLGKLKDNVVSKSKDFIGMIKSDAGGSTSPDKDDKNKSKHPDKNMFFSGDELQDGQMGECMMSPLPFQNKVLDNLDGQAKYWFGKDYTNFIMKDFTNLDAPYVDLVDRKSCPRMPWHDIGCVVIGQSARDVARHFIERWNAVKLEKARDNLTFPYLLPKSYLDIRFDDKLLSVPLQRVTCQILRSVSSWSCGFLEPDLVEQSIHDAYIQTISKAQHYIYIENQFFISLDGGNGAIRNQIAETIFKRILRAFKEGRVFRVYVVMPLLPGFEGDIGGTTGISIRAITHWNYSSINRVKSSLLNRMKAAGILDPSEYISFFSLRTNAMLQGTPVTELIYVHSKLLISDDKTVICGSANINDRSLIGKRDSEIACIINDESYEEGRMNGEPYPSGSYAGKLRKFLFKEHLGLLEPDPERAHIDVTDPVIDSFWNGIWKRTSMRNTKIYDEVFRCIPTDEAKNFIELKKFIEEPSLVKTDIKLAIKEIKRIQGHLVDLPLQFLNQEILTPPSTSKEGLIPTSVWT